MICFVVETPLADDQVCPTVLHPLDHIQELLLLVLPQLLVLLHGRDIEFMLRLRTGWLERTCEDRKSGITDGVGHLRVGHILVDENALDECGIAEGATDFAIDFDQIKKNVFPLEIGDLENGIYCDLSKLSVLFRDASCSQDQNRDEQEDSKNIDILLPREVMAVLRRFSVSSFVYSTRSAMRSRF